MIFDKEDKNYSMQNEMRPEYHVEELSFARVQRNGFREKAKLKWRLLACNNMICNCPK